MKSLFTGSTEHFNRPSGSIFKKNTWLIVWADLVVSEFNGPTSETVDVKIAHKML